MQTTLSGCVASLRSSTQLLDSSIAVLDAGVSDYPRLTKVLQTTRHYELVSEHDLTSAQAALLGEIEPEVEQLLARVDAHLDRLARREQSLMARADLQAGRLSSYAEQSAATARNASNNKARSAVEEIKMTQLRQKKDRLSYAVSRLELQANQRERQLRKSMAAQ